MYQAENEAQRTRAQFEADELDVRGGIGAAPGSMTINVPGLSKQTMIAVHPDNARLLLAIDATASVCRDFLQPRLSGDWNSKAIIRRMIWEVFQRSVQAARPGVEDGDWADALFTEVSERPDGEGTGDWGNAGPSEDE